MSAIFSIDLAQEPQYLDLLDVASGYGAMSVPVEGFFPGDTVDALFLTIQGTGLTTITAAIDQVQRTQGYFEWDSASSISGHFSLTAAQTALIAAATECTYSVQIQVTRSGNSYMREVQSGNIAVRPSIPSPPLIVTSIAISGGPVVGAIGTQTQLAAICYDSAGNAVPGVSVAWASSDEGVATVDDDGLVTIVALGGCNITVSTYGVSALTLATGSPMPFGVGSILYADTISTVAFLPIGSAHQYLRTNAGATAPEWDTLTAADIGPGVFQTGAFTFGGNVLFSGDNTYDLGATGATRPRDLFLGRNIVVGGTTAFGGLTYTWPGSQSANKVLKTDGAGALSWATPTEEIALTDLTDVSISAVANGQMLRYDSGSSLWVNSFDASLLTALNATQLTSGTVPNARLTGGYTGVTALGTQAADLLFVDATYDIGKTGATRPRDIFASRNAVVGGTLDVTGTSTLGVVGAGATTVTTLHASSTSNLDGDVTLGGNIIFSTAAARLIPGATSFSLRNNANGADNIFVTDAGAVTFRSTVGGITTLTATTIGGTLSTAAQPNVTSIGTLAANLLFVDATYDIGQSGATRPRHGYFSGNVTVGSSFIGALQKTLTFGTHLSGSSFNNSADVTLATDATDANTVSTIVARDGSGNFSAGTITATVTGHSSLDLPLTGGTLTGALLFTDNLYDIGASGLTRPRSGFFATNVTVGGVFIGALQNTLTFGTHLAAGGSSFNNSASVTISTDATSANTASTIVARDGSGNFTAGTVTATLSGSAPAGSLSGSTLAAGVTASSLTSFGTLAADLLFVDATYDIGKTGATRPRDLFLSRNLVVGGTFAVTGASTLGAISAIGTISSDLLFTDATYDIGKTGATRPRDLFISRNLTAGGTAAITGAVTLSSTLSIGGNVISDILFTDATYDVGKSGATRPRDGFFSRNFVIGGTLGVTGNVTFSGTGNSVGTITTGVWQGTTVAVGFGGTGLATYTIGDIVYASGTTTISKLAIGTGLQYLRTNAGATAPEWHTLVTADITDIASASTGITKVGALAIGSIAAGFGGATFGGNVIAGTDATYDLGASGANRFRDFFLSRNATIGGTLAAGATTVTTLSGTGAVSGFTTAAFSGLVTITKASGNALALETNAAATIQPLQSFRRGAAAAQWSLGFDASDRGAILNQAQTGVNMWWTNTGDFSMTGGVTTGGGTTTNTTTGTIKSLVSSGHNFVAEKTVGASFAFTQSDTLRGSIAGFNGSDGLIFYSGSGNTENLRYTGSAVAYSVNIIALTDATYDIGASGATRFRDFFLSRNATIGGLVTSTKTGAWLVANGATTGNVYQLTANTGGDLYIGVESSTGSSIFSGGTAYAGTIGTNANVPLQIWTKGLLAITVGTDQTSTFAGTIIGNAGISLSASNAVLQDYSDTNASAGTDTNVRYFRNSIQVGSITTTLLVTAYNTTSDMRLKIDRGIAAGSDRLRGTVIHEFDWMIEHRPDRRRDRGIFAQDEIARAPLNAVHHGTDEMTDAGVPVHPWSVDYSKYVPDLIVGWQEHDDDITSLKAFRDRAIAKYPDLAAAVQ